MSRNCILAASVFLVGCSGNPFFLQAQAASVCQHLSAQHFELPRDVRGVFARQPLAMQRGIALERTFEFDVRAEVPAETAAKLETHFALTSVRLSTVNAADDLGFVDEAHLQVGDRVFDYLRTEAAPRSVAWNGEAFDIAGYVQSGNLAYTVSLVGALRPGDVVVDVEACASVAVKLDYL